MIYPGGGKKGQPKAGDYVLAAEQTRAEAAASPHRSTAVDLARADKWEGQARTKQLPSTRTKIGAGGELIDIEIKSSSRQSLSTARNQTKSIAVSNASTAARTSNCSRASRAMAGPCGAM